MQSVLLAAGIAFLALGLPETSPADVYRWEDDGGGIHFTDTPSNIPAKYRGRGKLILKGPAASGRPSLSTIGSPAPSPGSPAPLEMSPETSFPSQEDRAGLAEQLRAKISAKERFIEGIDRKRSSALNPLGNRFVSPEDLELYKKYQEELPKDRERLLEISSGPP